MVMDIIGVMIGFVFVMLILSFMVTAIVQLLQNMFKLRSRNLYNCLNNYVEEMKDRHGAELTEGGSVRDFLVSYRFSPKPEEKGVIPTIRKFLFYPDVSWVDSSNFIDKFYEVFSKKSEIIKTDIENSFTALEGYMNKKFSRSVRFISILVAVFVTLIFQVDTLDLIRDLSTDKELRAKYVLAAEDWATENKDKIKAEPTYQDVSDLALRRLATKYPKNAPQIEQASGVGQDIEEMIDELYLILDSDKVVDKDDILEDYRKILEEIYKNRVRSNRQEIRALTSDLAILNITPFQHDLSYFTNLRHLIGLVITIIMISMGAPFWYDIFGKLLSLKDQLQPKKNDN